MQIVEYFSFLILLSNIAFAVYILFWKKFSKMLAPYALDLSFVAALAATLGSLILSEVLLYNPCKLCWFQRIFMYPLVFIIGIAKYRKIQKIWEIVIPLAVIGALFAVFHYYLQFAPNSGVTCGTVGISASCSEKQFTHYGYITIPWMALSMFAWIFVLMLSLKNHSKGKTK